MLRKFDTTAQGVLKGVFKYLEGYCKGKKLDLLFVR